MLRGASDVVMSAASSPRCWWSAPSWRRWRVVPTARDFGLMMILGVVAMAAFACVNRSLQARARERRRFRIIQHDRVGGGARLPGVRRRSGCISRFSGSLIIIAGGLYIFWREQVVTRSERILPRCLAPKRACSRAM